jgi:DNA-binding LytR/AlgR family response regulator
MYDLIFMDIYMKSLRGIETVEAIREKDENVTIAFTTSSPDHTRESYRLNALKYLEKPVTEKAVRDTLELALMKQKSRPMLTVTEAGGETADVYLDSILYFEHKNHVAELHTASRLIVTSQAARLDEFEKRLPSPPFLRCHRSYLINLAYVREADREKNCFFMKNGDRADIRRGQFPKCKRALDEWRLEQAGRLLE